MNVRVGVDASRALQSAQHKVFVEGSNDEEIDPIVIEQLLRNNGLTQIEVRPMGGCENVRSAAWAMIRHHPSYYFVIDRDDQDDVQVEDSWASFPDPEKANLIVWRKRELENYFIDPDYIENSQFLKKNCTKEKLREVIKKEASRRIFLDAANLTLHALHRSVRSPFCEHFKRPEDFSSFDDGKTVLFNLAAISEKSATVVSYLSKPSIETIYGDFVNLMTGGTIPLEYGTGEWLNRMSGKEIFRGIAGQCFTVKDRSGTVIQGKEQNIEVAKELLRLPLGNQPSDFQSLVAKIKDRVKTAG